MCVLLNDASLVCFFHLLGLLWYHYWWQACWPHHHGIGMFFFSFLFSFKKFITKIREETKKKANSYLTQKSYLNSSLMLSPRLLRTSVLSVLVKRASVTRVASSIASSLNSCFKVVTSPTSTVLVASLSMVSFQV